MTAVVRTAPGDVSGFPDRDLDGPVLDIFAGDAISLPLTWQVPAGLGTDGVTVVTPAAPVDMTGMQPGAEFLSYGQFPGQGVAMAVSNVDPTAGQFTVTAPGRGQAGDVTSALVPGPAMRDGPRVRVTYADAAGNPHTFGTFYLRIR